MTQNPWESSGKPAMQSAPAMPDGKVPLLPPGKETHVKVSAIDALMAVTKEENKFKIIGFLILMIVATNVIPVIPQIVMIGYLLYLVEARISRPGEAMLEFNFDYLMKYLGRGVWYFIAHLVLALILSIPLGILFFVLFFGMALIGAALGEAGIVVVLASWVLVIVLGMVISAVTAIFLAPAIFRAGVAGDFKAAFQWSWIKSFVGNTWKEAIIAWITLMVLSIPLGLLGLLACGVGVLVVGAVMSLASMILMGDLYRLHLSRGGEPILMEPKITLAQIAD